MVRLGRRAALVWIERRGRAVRAQRIWGERKEDAATKGVNGTKCQMKEREGSQKRDGGAEKGAAVGRDGGITAPCDLGGIPAAHCARMLLQLGMQADFGLGAWRRTCLIR